jgi:hypothetical protein
MKSDVPSWSELRARKAALERASSLGVLKLFLDHPRNLAGSQSQFRSD